MAFIKGNVTVREIDPINWELLDEIVYQGNEQTFTVPSGFSTDFASVPEAFTWLIPRYGLYTKAAILHDYLCREQPVNRADADGIFRRAMRELGVSFLRRWLMWTAVRFDSRLRNARPIEILQWFAIAIPAIIFLIIPYLVVVIWSAAFWLLEALVYGLKKPFNKKPDNMPSDFGITKET